MSEHGGQGGGGSVWPIAIGVGAGLLVLLLVVGGVVIFLMTTAVTVALPPPQIDEVVITAEVARTDGETSTGAETASRPARNCTVRLTGTGDGGTWYMIDQDICEGDEALKAAVGELVSDAGKRGERLAVKLEVVPNAGITPEAVTAAGKVCAAAGAEVSAPPAGGTAGEAGN